MASRRDVPAARVAPAWLISQPGIVAPIIGATAEHHLSDALTALTIELSSSEHAEVERPHLPRLTTDYT